MILLIFILLTRLIVETLQEKCPDPPDSGLWSSVNEYLIGYDLVQGPGDTGAWPLFVQQQPNRRVRGSAANHSAELCRTGKLRNRQGALVDVRLPPFVDNLETYPEPNVLDSALITFNSTWRAYADWRRRRFGAAQIAAITNETQYDDLYSIVEFPFRAAGGAASAYRDELSRLIDQGNRFFRISTTAIDGVVSVRPRSVDHLDPRFIEYLLAALDGGERLEPMNRFADWTRDDGYQDDDKTHNWFVIFSDAYGTHFPTTITFGHIFDVWINRTSCREQTAARLSELAQCYFAETKLNLSVSTSSSASSDGRLVNAAAAASSSSNPNAIEICPHLKSALRDLRPFVTHPNGRFEPLLIDSRHSLSDHLRRIPSEARRRDWRPTVVEARMSPICELVPLVKPNDLDAKVACETNLLKYAEAQSNDRRSSSAIIKCARDERKVITDLGVFCLSTRFADQSCPPNGASPAIVPSLVVLAISALIALSRT